MDRSRAINPIWWGKQALRRLEKAWRNLSAPGLFVASFALLISVGTAGLLLLPNLYTGPRLGFLDALFTITSAACVTGLIVVDTATYFTFWGQLWILIFVQLGGIGLITLTSLIIGIMGRRLSLRSEMIAAPPVQLLALREADRRGDAAGPLEGTLFGLLKTVAGFTLIIEGVGALGLWLAFLPELGPERAVWPAIFHAVNAFCNGGFSTYSDSLIRFADQPAVLLIISTLVVLGGLGYLSSEELIRWWRAGGRRGRHRLSTHTYAAITVSAMLLVAGFFLYAAFEWNGAFRNLGFVDKLVNAWFMSVTPRSSGFSAVPYDGIGNETAYLTILLMVVGGNPGSTAGGIKTTALAVLLGLAIQRMRGRRNAVIHHRSIPDGTVERTVSLALIAFGVMTAAVFWLSFTETRGVELEEARAAFLPIFFEAVSAFCTVGLSMDVTPTLSSVGKLSLVVLMFVGRVGPLSFFAALSLRARTTLREVRPAREDLIIG